MSQEDVLRVINENRDSEGTLGKAQHHDFIAFTKDLGCVSLGFLRLTFFFHKGYILDGFPYEYSIFLKN